MRMQKAQRSEDMRAAMKMLREGTIVQIERLCDGMKRQRMMRRVEVYDLYECRGQSQSMNGVVQYHWDVTNKQYMQQWLWAKAG